MFIDKDSYLKIKELEDFGVMAIYTKNKLGDIRDKSVQEQIIKVLKIEEKIIYSGFQTHSDNIVVIDKDTPVYTENCDGFITDRKDVAIFTKYADCLPIYIYDKEKKIFGCVHSGWSGSYKKIGVKAIEIVLKKYNSKIENIIVAFGIGISPEKYEVGEEFYLKFKERFNDEELNKAFIRKENRYFFDNQRFNYNLMKGIGIKEENIITNSLCTYDGEFHSYRRDKESSGRNGAYIYFK